MLIELHGCIYDHWVQDRRDNTFFTFIHKGHTVKGRCYTSCIQSRSGSNLSCMRIRRILCQFLKIKLQILSSNWFLRKHYILLRNLTCTWPKFLYQPQSLSLLRLSTILIINLLLYEFKHEVIIPCITDAFLIFTSEEHMTLNNFVLVISTIKGARTHVRHSFSKW